MNKFINKKNLILLFSLIMLYVIVKLPYTKEIILYLFLFSTISIGSYTCTYFFSKKSEQTIPLYLLILFIYLYLFGLFNQLIFGFYSFVILTYILGLYSLYRTIIDKKTRFFKNLFLRPGYAVFSVLYFCFALFTRNAAFYVWDEFTFWSIASKNMYYLNNFYVLKGTTLYSFYPPSPVIYQYFFCKSLMNYSQGIELFASYMLSFSLMLPLLKNIDMNNKKQLIAGLLTIIIIPSIFCNNNFYQTIYVDVLLGILAAYIFVEYFSEDDNKFKYLELSLALAVLSSTKSTGFIMSGILIFAFIIDLLISFVNGKIIFNKITKKNVLRIMLLLFVIFTVFISWKIYVRLNLGEYNNGYNHNMYQNNNTIMGMIRCMFDTSIGNGVPSNKTFRTFMLHVFDTTVYIKKPFDIYGSTLLFMFVIGYLSIYRALERDKDFYKKSIIVCIYTLLYVLFIQVAYYLIFASAEGASHSSIERYIGTSCVTLLLFIYAEIFINRKLRMKKDLVFVAAVILLLFAPANAISDATLTSASHNAEMQGGISNQKNFADYVISKTTKSDRLFAIHQTQNQDSLFIQFRYFMTPRMIPMIDSFSSSELYQFERFKDYKELSKELFEKYDYVIILNSDDYFDENFSILFENEIIEPWSLYKIIKNDDKTIKIKRVI